MSNRFETPDGHGFLGGERVLLPDGSLCAVKVLGRVVLIEPIRVAEGPDGEERIENYRIGADGSIIAHARTARGDHESGREVATGWGLSDLRRL